MAKLLRKTPFLTYNNHATSFSNIKLNFEMCLTPKPVSAASNCEMFVVQRDVRALQHVQGFIGHACRKHPFCTIKCLPAPYAPTDVDPVI